MGGGKLNELGFRGDPVGRRPHRTGPYWCELMAGRVPGALGSPATGAASIYVLGRRAVRCPWPGCQLVVGWGRSVLGDLLGIALRVPRVAYWRLEPCV
jgi:hypothetical protein